MNTSTGSTTLTTSKLSASQKGYIGTLINTNNPVYPGIALEVQLNEQVTPKLFDQILSTFKFLP